MVEDRGSRIEDRVITHTAIFNLQSSIFDPLSRFCLSEEKSCLARPHLLLTVYKKKGIFLSEHLEEPAASR
jgi:hypothetical protein